MTFNLNLLDAALNWILLAYCVGFHYSSVQLLIHYHATEGKEGTLRHRVSDRGEKPNPLSLLPRILLMHGLEFTFLPSDARLNDFSLHTPYYSLVGVFKWT